MKKLEAMNSMINLPDDVLINRILLKLDTKSLGKLRCVCKYLRSSITSPDFVKMHCHVQFNNHPLILLVSSDKSLFFSINFNDSEISPCFLENVKIASGPLPQSPCFFRSSSDPFSPPQPLFFGSCNGLLCLVERENSQPSLWNPTTKEYKQLPPPFSRTETPFSSHPGIIFGCSRVVTYGLGYDSIIDDYKVVQCEKLIYRQYSPVPLHPGDITGNTIIDFQVYTLGTDTWSRINDNPYESYCTTPCHYKTPGMFVNGALHWILGEKESFGSKIIALDIEKEMFRAEVPKPHSNLSDSSYNWSLHVLKGCLCIYERLERESSPCIDVWMMKDYGVIESWTILFTIVDFHAFQTPCMDFFKVLNFCENGEVIFANESLKGLLVYDPISREFQAINLREIPGAISYKEIHTESLVSLNTGIYRYGMVENKPAEEIQMKKRKILT